MIVRVIFAGGNAPFEAPVHAGVIDFPPEKTPRIIKIQFVEDPK